jgi:hypothetical protein
LVQASGLQARRLPHTCLSQCYLTQVQHVSRIKGQVSSFVAEAFVLLTFPAFFPVFQSSPTFYRSMRRSRLSRPSPTNNTHKQSIVKCLLYAAYYTLHIKQNKLHGLSPQANYTDRVTAACRRSDCQLLRLEGATWSA